MKFSTAFCIIFSGISMIMDIKWEKVYNYWIACGLLCSVVNCLACSQQTEIMKQIFGMLIPIAVLFPLFLGKMLGTGDIKVFAVLGSMMGVRWILVCMVWSFIIGAVIAVPVLLLRCNAKERFTYFFTYLNHVLITKTFPPYLAPGKRPENIHFTIPIFCSVLLLSVKGGAI